VCSSSAAAPRQRATLAQHGTLAGRHEASRRFSGRTGVALVDSIDALVETAALFDVAPLPQAIAW